VVITTLITYSPLPFRELVRAWPSDKGLDAAANEEAFSFIDGYFSHHLQNSSPQYPQGNAPVAYRCVVRKV
jgi:hypothetical protein